MNDALDFLVCVVGLALGLLLFTFVAIITNKWAWIAAGAVAVALIVS